VRRGSIPKPISVNELLTQQGVLNLNEEFQKMTFDQKVSYLVDNLRDLPDELAEQGVEILASAGETEYAAVLARDKGLVDKAISILVNEGDYLWAALIAKNDGRAEESGRLYRDGLQYYIDMEMFGRAISAATALGLPADQVDDLFRRGIESESRGMDIAHTHAMIDSAMESLEISLIGREDEISRQIVTAVNEERGKMEEKERAEEEKRTKVEGQGKKS
jgi:hypothetical protein